MAGSYEDLLFTCDRPAGKKVYTQFFESYTIISSSVCCVIPCLWWGTSIESISSWSYFWFRQCQQNAVQVHTVRDFIHRIAYSVFQNVHIAEILSIRKRLNRFRFYLQIRYIVIHHLARLWKCLSWNASRQELVVTVFLDGLIRAT